MPVATILCSTTLDILDFIPGSSQSNSSLVFKRIEFIKLQISILSFMVVLKHVLIYLDMETNYHFLECRLALVTCFWQIECEGSDAP